MPFSDPERVVGEFGLAPGMTVADLGAGSGAYALAMARRPGVKVIAVEVQKDLVERLASEARTRHLDLEVVWGDIEKLGGTKLRDGSVDLALLANVLFQTSGKYTAALEVKRLLRSGGRAVIIDWSDSFGGLGPKQSEVIKPETTTEIFAQAGFRKERDFVAGDHHWGIIFVKQQ